MNETELRLKVDNAVRLATLNGEFLKKLEQRVSNLEAHHKTTGEIQNELTDQLENWLEEQARSLTEQASRSIISKVGSWISRTILRRK